MNLSSNISKEEIRNLYLAGDNKQANQVLKIQIYKKSIPTHIRIIKTNLEKIKHLVKDGKFLIDCAHVGAYLKYNKKIDKWKITSTQFDTEWDSLDKMLAIIKERLYYQPRRLYHVDAEMAVL